MKAEGRAAEMRETEAKSDEGRRVCRRAGQWVCDSAARVLSLFSFASHFSSSLFPNHSFYIYIYIF